MKYLLIILITAGFVSCEKNQVLVCPTIIDKGIDSNGSFWLKDSKHKFIVTEQYYNIKNIGDKTCN